MLYSLSNFDVVAIQNLHRVRKKVQLISEHM